MKIKTIQTGISILLHFVFILGFEFKLHLFLVLYRYIIATQDPALRDIARQIPGTPILYLYYRSPTLEKPSYASLHTAGQSVHARYEL